VAHCGLLYSTPLEAAAEHTVKELYFIVTPVNIERATASVYLAVAPSPRGTIRQQLIRSDVNTSL
jgi:hypothetical protein